MRLLGGRFEATILLRLQPSTISRWCRRGFIPKGIDAKRVADATGGKVTVDELVTPPERPQRARDKRREQRVA